MIILDKKKRFPSSQKEVYLKGEFSIILSARRTKYVENVLAKLFLFSFEYNSPHSTGKLVIHRTGLNTRNYIFMTIRGRYYCTGLPTKDDTIKKIPQTH